MPVANKAGGPLGWFAASAAGRKVISFPGEPTSTLRWVDRDGRAAATLGQPAPYWTLRLSHDGQRALVNEQGGSFAIDRRTGLKTRMRSDAATGIWSADDRDLIVGGSDRLWIQRASGEGEPRQVMVFKERLLRPHDASLDGRTILVRAEPAPGTPSLDLLIMKLADGTTTPFAATLD